MNFNSVAVRKVSAGASRFGMCSLPALPGRGKFSIEGARVQSTPVGFWPESALRHPHNTQLWQRHGWQAPDETNASGLWPRRLLTFFEFENAAPDALSIAVHNSQEKFSRGAEDSSEYSGDENSTGWKVETTEEAFVQRKDAEFAHTCSDLDARLKLEFAGHECNLQFGWQTKQSTLGANPRAWQWINAQRLWSGPLAEAWQVGGHIYVGESESRLTNEQAARWYELPEADEQMIFAQVFLLLFRNGTVDCRAHFVNGELYGRGGFVAGRPLISFQSSDDIACGNGRGWNIDSQHQKPFGGNSDEAFSQQGDTLYWQPFSDTQQILGRRTDNGEAVFAPDSESGFPRGAARTAHFELALGDAELPARYLPQPEYSLLGGNWGMALDADAKLPAGFEDLPELAGAARSVFLRNNLREGFCAGGTFRYLDHYPDKRWEFSCDANETASFFRAAYATQDAALYELALVNADYNADLGCDHTQFTWHYHEAQPRREIYSLIYMRFAGLVYAHLETGDPYYLNTAEAVANRWISTHRANWPRRGIGRDAEPVEGILSLYDFTGQEYYLDAARQIARDAVTSLYDNGAWRSGAGSGPFWGTNALPGTPWNGAHLLAGVSEFLLRVTPEDSSWNEVVAGGARLLRHTLEMLKGPELAGFHRASMSYAWRRHFALAAFTGDAEIQAGVLRALQTALQRFRDEGEGFFLSGHHCAGYLDHIWFFKAVAETMSEPAFLDSVPRITLQ